MNTNEEACAIPTLFRRGSFKLYLNNRDKAEIEKSKHSADIVDSLSQSIAANLSIRVIENDSEDSVIDYSQTEGDCLEKQPIHSFVVRPPGGVFYDEYLDDIPSNQYRESATGNRRKRDCLEVNIVIRIVRF